MQVVSESLNEVERISSYASRPVGESRLSRPLFGIAGSFQDSPRTVAFAGVHHIPSLFTIGASNERVQELGLDCCSIFERTLPDLGNIGRSRL